MELSLRTCLALLLYSLAFISSHATVFTGVDVETNQEVNITPTVVLESVLIDKPIRCARVNVSGLSRLKLGSYSSAHKVTLVPSHEIPEKFYKRIQICLHNNASVGSCQCDSDDWEIIHNGIWSSTMSPYGNRYIDVKFVDNLSGSVTVSINEEFQRWRLFCLVSGLVLLLLAPIVSGWVPFYYSSSMAIGVCLVVLILLFQGMKLLPTGRKTALYSGLYGLAIGAGSFLLKRFSMFVNSILVNFGISEEMHNPVLVFIIVGIVLAGAGFGYWLVRKYVVTEDGTVEVGIAQFVKWAIRIIAVTFIIQSSLDTPLAMAVLICIFGTYHSFTSMYQSRHRPWGWSNRRLNSKKRTEFLSRSGAKNSSGMLRKRTASPPAWANSPVKGIISPSRRRNLRSPLSSQGPAVTPEDYYSTFHNTPNRKKFSEEEWKEFTEESTKHAIAELASSPEFTNWIIKNQDKIRLHPDDTSEESIGSGSDSSAEDVAESSSGKGLAWQRRW